MDESADREVVDEAAMLAHLAGLGGETGRAAVLAFAHQHAGRNHVDQGRYAPAVTAFRTALALRETYHAPPDQLESSLGALRAAEQRLADHEARDTDIRRSWT